MGKFYGAIGYGKDKEAAPGVWIPDISERNYTGDVIRNASKWRDGENLNSNLVVDNKISIVADPFAYANCHTMRYVQWMGTKWKINSIDVQRPRIILTLGEVYNEPETVETP